MPKSNKPKVKYVQVNNGVFRIELIEGNPPASMILATPRGIKALSRGRQLRNLSQYYLNKEIVNIDFNDFYFTLKEE